MRNNETGEFEMVVGNKQLLSGFFIIVLLFAVAFAMGYVVGQNSRTGKTQAQAPSGGAAVNTAEARPQPAPVPAAPPREAPAKAAEAEDAPSDAPAQPTTQPAREAEPASTPVSRAGAALPPAPVKSEAPAEAAELPPGSYWQVSAIANKEAAQMLVQTLKDKGLPALASPGPNNLTRVLVGPYSDTAGMGRAKTELENAGFNRLGSLRR